MRDRYSLLCEERVLDEEGPVAMVTSAADASRGCRRRAADADFARDRHLRLRVRNLESNELGFAPDASSAAHQHRAQRRSIQMKQAVLKKQEAVLKATAVRSPLQRQ